MIGLGCIARKPGLISEEANGIIARFVFLFALPVMLFRFASALEISEIVNGPFILAYWLAGLSVYVVATLVARMRKVGGSVAAEEAQCATFGNSGFLAIP